MVYPSLNHIPNDSRPRLLDRSVTPACKRWPWAHVGWSNLDVDLEGFIRLGLPLDRVQDHVGMHRYAVKIDATQGV